MSRNCRFAVAVHTCTLLGMSEGQPLTSDWIAGSVNTNPVVIRRILAALARAGLVTSIRGSNGGSVLARAPQAVTLLDIQRAVDEETEPALHNQTPNQDCPVGRGIQPALRVIIDRAESAREAVLSATLLAEIIERIGPCR